MRDGYQEIVAALAAKTPMSLSRWGDGEWHTLLGHSGQNCDGQAYTTRLRDALERVLLDRPMYRLGLQPFAAERFESEIDAWLTARGLRPDWIDGDLFVQRSIRGTLDAFLTALESRAVLLVGPTYLATLSLLPIRRHLPIPSRGAFDIWPGILNRIRSALHETRADVVLLSAGMSSNLIVHALSVSHPAVSTLDMGSLWEPYVGKATRTYHHEILARDFA